MARRSYAGGVKGVTLTAPITEIATAMSVSNLVGVPSGSSGAFAVVVDKGEPNEEKMLVSTAAAGTMTIGIRGYDGTTPQAHSAGAEVRLVITAIDADEANAHVNSSVGVHGAGVGVALLNESGAQTVTNKTIDGDQNTIRDVKLALQPEIVAALDAEALARTNGDAARYTKAEADALLALRAPIDLPEDLMDAHLNDPDPHDQYLFHDGTTDRRLSRDKFPKESITSQVSNRRVSAALTNFTATDANPQRILGTLTLPTIASEVAQDRMWRISLLIPGFTTNQTDDDFCRFTVQLVSDREGWWPHTNPNHNGPVQAVRMRGNITGTPWGGYGVHLQGWFMSPADGGGGVIQAVLQKLSGAGTANVTTEIGEDEAHFVAVQEV